MFPISVPAFDIRKGKERFSQTIQIPVSNSTVNSSVKIKHFIFYHGFKSVLAFEITFLLHDFGKSIKTICFHLQL